MMRSGFIAGAVLSISLWAWLQFVLGSRADHLPTPGAAAGSRTISLVVGDNWSILGLRGPWWETAAVEFGRQAALVTNAKGEPMYAPFPSDLPGRSRVLAIRAADGRSRVLVRATGWPLRTWTTRKTTTSGGRTFQESEVLLSGTVLSSLGAGIVGGAGVAAIIRLARAVQTAVRKSSDQWPSCGYDIRGTPRGTPCPECGNPFHITSE